jgi:hypothetical protein
MDAVIGMPSPPTASAEKLRSGSQWLREINHNGYGSQYIMSFN